MIFPANQLFDFFNSKVTYKRVDVVSANKHRTNNPWYAKKALVKKYFLNIFWAFLQLYIPDFWALKLLYYSFWSLNLISPMLALYRPLLFSFTLNMSQNWGNHSETCILQRKTYYIHGKVDFEEIRPNILGLDKLALVREIYSLGRIQVFSACLL